MKQKIGVVGLGHVGLPIVAALANVGYQVICIDVDREKVKKLQQTYEPPMYEPGLSETMKLNQEKIEFTVDYDYFMKECSAILITVGTPVKADGTPDYELLNSAITSIGKKLRKGQLIVLKSTVVPGTTENLVAPKLEELSGLKAGSDFYVAFCPERTIEGLALYELYTLPKIVGGVDAKSADRAAAVIRKLGGRIIKVSSPRVAEICKLVDNLYRAMNIGLGNEIGQICEKLGIDAYEVTCAVNTAYARTHLYRAGLGADGPCLSKDPQILRSYAREKGLDTDMLEACVITNEKATSRVASICSRFIKSKKISTPQVSLVELAFKGFPETDDLRGSPAIKIHNALKREFSKIEFKYYDPFIKNFLGNSTAETLNGCIKNSNVVLFLTDHQSFMNIDVKDILKNAGRPLLIVDCWHNITNPEIKEKDVKIFRIGDGLSSKF